MTECTLCEKTMVMPFGPKDSPILIIRSEVNERDVHTRPWNDRNGEILRKEMYDMHLDLNGMRQAVLYNHSPIKDGCDDICLSVLYPELRNKKLIVLVGAAAVSYFTGGMYGVDETKGLDISDEISADVSEYVDFDVRWLALENPAMAFMKGIGELRFGLSKMEQMIGED